MTSVGIVSKEKRNTRREHTYTYNTKRDNEKVNSVQKIREKDMNKEDGNHQI